MKTATLAMIPRIVGRCFSWSCFTAAAVSWP